MATGHQDHSGTPLPTKLGVREGSRVLIVGAPDGFEELLAPLPPGVRRLRGVGAELDVALVFAIRRAELDRRVPGLLRSLAPDGRLWLAWPKKAAKVDTDLTFETVQTLGLDAGLVDNKSASITDVFQGLQFVYRLRDRPARR
jgi:hypothetical protein